MEDQINSGSSQNPINEDEMTYEQFLVYSARCGDKPEVQEMIDVTGPPVDLNYRDNTMSNNTALHMACGNGHSEIVKLLLAQPSI